MKLEQQVCSLELAKKLKDLGVKQESLWWWNGYGEGINDWQIQSEYRLAKERNCSAFTVAELGEMLPAYFASHKRDDIGDWLCFDNQYEKLTDDDFQGNTEADARAKMLIYLIENKLITV